MVNKMTIYYEDRRQTRKDGWQFWLVKGPSDKWIKIAGARREPEDISGTEIYEKYARHEKINHIDDSKDVSKEEFIQWFKDTFNMGSPFDLIQTKNSNVKGARINQVSDSFYLDHPFDSIWSDPKKIYDYAIKIYK